jgi:hypothetical protein
MKKHNEPVPVDCLGDKPPRSFLLDMSAAMEIEESLGVNVSRGLKEFSAALLSPAGIVKITRALLRHETPNLTVEAIAKMITLSETQSALMTFAMRAAYHFHGLSDEQYDAAVADAQKRREEMEAEGQAVPLASGPKTQ